MADSTIISGSAQNSKLLYLTREKVIDTGNLDPKKWYMVQDIGSAGNLLQTRFAGIQNEDIFYNKDGVQGLANISDNKAAKLIPFGAEEITSNSFSMTMTKESSSVKVWKNTHAIYSVSFGSDTTIEFGGVMDYGSPFYKKLTGVFTTSVVLENKDVSKKYEKTTPVANDLVEFLYLEDIENTRHTEYTCWYLPVLLTSYPVEANGSDLIPFNISGVIDGSRKPSAIIVTKDYYAGTAGV